MHESWVILAAKIESVHESFGFSGKVGSTVTDNRTNFVKAFTTYALPALDVPESSDTEDNIELEEVTFVDVAELMVSDQVDAQDDSTQIDYELPPYQRCAAHTLNLVASTDVDKFLSSSPASRSLYRSAFSKCMAL